jgi:hypothetical protein
MGKLNFEENREKRIERFEKLSEKASKQSDEAYKQSHRMTENIPMGQPILVGHHSEKGHRRLLDKSWNKLGQSVKLSEKSEYYKDKAESAKNNASISSDDPNALEKLQQKLTVLEKLQEKMKAINRVCRSKKLSEIEMFEKLKADFQLDETSINNLLNPRQAYLGKGFASYTLTNNNAKINQVKKRIKRLEALEKLESKTYDFGNVQLKLNAEDNRIELYFPGKPSYEFRKKLKSNGFRWSPRKSAWQKQISNWNFRTAKELANDYNNL